jgi:hypothetical protein
MPRLRILLAVLLPLLTVEAASPAQHFNLRAKILSVGTVSSAMPRDYIRTDFDAQVVVTVRVISVVPHDARFLPHHTVSLAIHSPSLLFIAEDPRGRTYDLELRAPKAGSSLWSLHLRREKLNQTMQ